MNELSPQIDINVKLFNDRLNKESQAADALAWVQEVMHGELAYLLTFGGGHILDLVTGKPGLKKKAAYSLLFTILTSPLNDHLQPLQMGLK